jgi:predicted alpha-1,2-mannosidase
LRGKLSNGSWLLPFEPHTWGGTYVEGSAWQYRFAVPHDPGGLTEAMGGNSRLLSFLEEMLAQPPVFHVGSYGAEIHEMSEMAAVDFGQYAHSNQPVHHFLYFFTLAGRRDRTQYWVHRVLNELYSPDDFPGDEDTGAMSAWYVLSALGIFSLCPGRPDWVLGAPLFEQADLQLSNGNKISIEGIRKDGAAFFDQVSLNGLEHKGPAVTHSELVQGGKLRFRAT